MGLTLPSGLQSGTRAQWNHFKSVRNITRRPFVAKYFQNKSPRTSPIFRMSKQPWNRAKLHTPAMLGMMEWAPRLISRALMKHGDLNMLFFSHTWPFFEMFPLCFLKVWLMNCWLYWVFSCILALKRLGHENYKVKKSCHREIHLECCWKLSSKWHRLDRCGRTFRSSFLAQAWSRAVASPCRSTGEALMFHNT